ncbi:hypothetical protein H0B56_08240 [Haloechinothrix sp. YIM 98757]|uniref:Uncharacterized protein n=1 Tax=Haloechinothrix aidingensis TaxID=2752311 RepID=A0A838A994_9PSEU|nr:DUF5677 domain-containing protein [Haloechinothrix aidingensis]MBA0125527.1 hypothetical protein [Haloechinothrix aidingensis]
MSSRKKPRNKRRNSRLKDHKQTGKILKPPMRTIGNMQMVPWLRDSFPDMLWLCALIKLYGDKPGMLLAGKVLDRIDSVLGLEEGDGSEDSKRLILTGEMTTFDKIAVEDRSAVLAALQEDGLFEQTFPWVLVRALQKYHSPPAAWLFEGWRGNDKIIPDNQPEQFLRELISDASHGQSAMATKAKAMVIRAWLKTGKLMLAKEIGEVWDNILPRYPDEITEEERQRIEPSIRATFMTLTSNPDRELEKSPGLTWAKTFWRQNWKLYECGDSSADAEHSLDATSEHVKAAHAAWQHVLDEVTERFLAASRAADPDLYAPDRHEILTGLVYRQIRALGVMIGFPALWTMEHGSSTIRGVLEARILVKWLLLQDDPELYSRFKDYGRGKLKLLKLHLEEYRESLSSPAAELDEQIEYMDALVNRDIMEEFQDISIEGNFAGLDTRRMADQVGLLTDYRLVFQPASSNMHGEWASLDQYTLSTCRNPLHRWHRIPNSDPMLTLGPHVVEIALGMLDDLVADYEEGLKS